MECWILAGDIGATKAILTLFEWNEGRLLPIREGSYRSANHPSLDALVGEFLASETHRVAAACLGVPGPVQEGRCETPNLPWVIDQRSLQQTLAIANLTLVNDLAAMANGISLLSDEQFAVLNPGEAQREGNAALIAAGTGLGEAILFWNGQEWRPSASEGGHVDFAPSSEVEIALLRYLNREYGHTSYERILSGPGLHNLYRFLRDTSGDEEPEWLAKRFSQEDPGVVITETALSGAWPRCVAALDLFVRVYGAEAGNLALKALATGGVYLGGGIAPKILPVLQGGAFLEAFTRKGRLSRFLSRIPVRVILEPRSALYGAVRYAMLSLTTGEMPQDPPVDNSRREGMEPLSSQREADSAWNSTERLQA